MTQPIVAILAFSPIRHDVRVLRQITYLSKHFWLVVIGYGSLENVPPGVEYHAIAPPKGLGLGRKVRSALYLPLGRLFPTWAYEAWYWQRSDRQLMLKLLNETQAHFIHANDWNTLPIAARIAQTSQARLILDLHEYAPLQYSSRSYHGLFFNPLADYVIRQYGGQATATITVSHSIAEKYQQVYGLKPQVIMNAPPHNSAIQFTPTNQQNIRLIHHGVAIPARRLDLLIRTLAQTEPRYTLHFLLTNPTSAYVSRLQRLAERLAPGRVFFHPAVKPQEIVSRIAEFDMGFYLLPPTCFNQAAALPNKFFDFIAAGLAICIGPSLEMVRLVEQYGFGAVASSFDPGDAAQLLNSLTAKDIDEMKRNALAARKVLNAEVEMSKLVDLYASLG